MANLSWLKQKKICFLHEDIDKDGRLAIETFKGSFQLNPIYDSFIHCIGRKNWQQGDKKRKAPPTQESTLGREKKKLGWITKPKRISTQSKTETQSITTVMKFQLETTVHQLQTHVVQNAKCKDATGTLLADFLLSKPQLLAPNYSLYLLAGPVEDQLWLIAISENSSHSPFLTCNFTHPLPVVCTTGFPVSKLSSCYPLCKTVIISWPL